MGYLSLKREKKGGFWGKGEPRKGGGGKGETWTRLGEKKPRRAFKSEKKGGGKRRRRGNPVLFWEERGKIKERKKEKAPSNIWDKGKSTIYYLGFEDRGGEKKNNPKKKKKKERKIRPFRRKEKKKRCVIVQRGKKGKRKEEKKKKQVWGFFFPRERGGKRGKRGTITILLE